MPTPYSSPGVFNVLDPWVDVAGAYVGMAPNSVSAAAQKTAVLQGIINLCTANEMRRGQSAALRSYTEFFVFHA